jgi:hypothetical protein
MAGRAMQRSIVMGDRRIMVCADRIAGTEALSLNSGLEDGCDLFATQLCRARLLAWSALESRYGIFLTC